jgi:hypothetical protein
MMYFFAGFNSLHLHYEKIINIKFDDRALIMQKQYPWYVFEFEEVGDWSY